MPDPLTVQHRQAIENLSTVTRRQLTRFVPTDGPPDRIRDALFELVPAVGDTYGQAAGALGADYYDEFRAKQAVSGRFVATPAELPDVDRYETLVRWGVEPLYQANPDVATAISKVSGGLQRVVAQQARTTVSDSAMADPEAHGWRRVTSGETCKFCLMLVGRGAVYTDKTVRFVAHDDCNCAAEPAFTTGPAPSRQAYLASVRTD